MIKFTKDHINLLSLANEKVQDLQRQQMKIYEDLLQNLPDLSKESKTKIKAILHYFRNHDYHKTHKF